MKWQEIVPFWLNFPPFLSILQTHFGPKEQQKNTALKDITGRSKNCRNYSVLRVTCLPLVSQPCRMVFPGLFLMVEWFWRERRRIIMRGHQTGLNSKRFFEFLHLWALIIRDTVHWKKVQMLKKMLQEFYIPHKLLHSVRRFVTEIKFSFSDEIMRKSISCKTFTT